MGFRQFLAIEMMLRGVPEFAMQSGPLNNAQKRMLGGNSNIADQCYWDRGLFNTKGSARSVLSRACHPSRAVLQQVLTLAEHLKNDSVNWAYNDADEWEAVAQVAALNKKEPVYACTPVWNTLLKDDITWDFDSGYWVGKTLSSAGLFEMLLKTGSVQGTPLLVG